MLFPFYQLPFDILSHIFEYYDTYTYEKIHPEFKSFRELTMKKRITEKRIFLETFETQINSHSKRYFFNIDSIRIYLENINLHDASLVENGTNRFVIDGKLVDDNRENLIHSVIEFAPERAYEFLESFTRDILIYNGNDCVILINTDDIDISQSNMSRYNSVTVLLGPLVTKIKGRAFYRFTNLTSIIIPKSVTEIGYEAFRSCSSLKSIIIPNSVTSIEDAVFYRCSNLTSVVIPDSVTWIGNGAFHDCSSLRSIVIPSSVLHIGERAFSGCPKLNINMR
jgi:hypothetical protein